MTSRMPSSGRPLWPSILGLGSWSWSDVEHVWGDNWENVASPKFLDIAFAFGLIVATMVWSIGHISGGHINPAVTCGMLVARKITIARAVLYIISQCLGAISGAGILAGEDQN